MSGRIMEIGAAEFDREVLQYQGPAVVDFYSTECPPCEALAAKFEPLSLLYGDDVKFIKVFRQDNRALAESLSVRASPTLLFYKNGTETGQRLTGAVHRSTLQRELDQLITSERAERIHAEVPHTRTDCDLLILGAGPAGLTAGIYAAQARLDTIAVDPALGGGNLAITHQVSNFPGFPKPQPGFMLAHYMVEHAKEAGVKLRLASEVTSVDLDALSVQLDGHHTVQARRMLVATGSAPRLIGVKGETEFKGHGISYCATCDAKYYQDKHVVVIGGGNSAIEESLFISRFASRITVVHQFAELQANRHAQEQAFANDKIRFVLQHEPREFVSNGKWVDGVVVEDLKTGKRDTIACDGVFIFAGMRPNLDPFPGAFQLDEWGYVKADPDMRTSRQGVFAAGDVISKRYRQMTTAVADGTIASMAIARELGA